jgi:hypothetical protein
MVFVLDDQFDSYSDAASMTSLQYEMHLNERGQKVDSIQRMTATGREPAPPHATETRVLPGTRDPLGMLQYLRNVDWTKTAEVRSPSTMGTNCTTCARNSWDRARRLPFQPEPLRPRRSKCGFLKTAKR